MDIITTLYTEKIIRQNECQMSFLDNFLLKQNVDKNDDNCNYFLMLEFPFTPDDDEMNKRVSQSTRLEPTIEHLMKESTLFCRQHAIW